MQLWISRTMSLQNWEMRLVNWRTVRSWQKMVLRKSVNKKCWKRGYWTSELCWKHAEDLCKTNRTEGVSTNKQTTNWENWRNRKWDLERMQWKRHWNFFKHFCLLFIEIVDWISISLFLSHPVCIENKYEATIQVTISFNQLIIFW